MRAVPSFEKIQPIWQCSFLQISLRLIIPMKKITNTVVKRYSCKITTSKNQIRAQRQTYGSAGIHPLTHSIQTAKQFFHLFTNFQVYF